jgi:hypothetical protein
MVHVLFIFILFIFILFLFYFWLLITSGKIILIVMLGVIANWGEAAPIPEPQGGMLVQVGRQVGKVALAGLGDWIGSVRTSVGRGGEFAERQGFQTDVQKGNALLQYTILNAYNMGEAIKVAHELLNRAEKSTNLMDDFVKAEGKSDDYMLVAMIGIFVTLLINLVVVVKVARADSTTNQNQNNVNIARG